MRFRSLRVRPHMQPQKPSAGKRASKESFTEARAFYGVIIVSMVIAVRVLFSPLDPIKALFWSAVINGIIAVPIIAAMMLIASRRDEMGVFVATSGQRILGWLTTIVMAWLQSFRCSSL